MEKKSQFEGDRIAKVLARAGVCSRRDAERLIADGRVAVNGRKLATPALNVTPSDHITVDGKPVGEPDPPRLWRYHKPAGLVTTNRDPQGRDTVFQKLPASLPRVNSVGRLDINTEGLLLLTNDGGMKRFLELPSTGWLRRYRVRAFGKADEARLKALKKGIEIDEVNYRSIDASLERVQGGNVWLTMSLREGKNREIKKVLEALDLQVNRLIRLSFGPFQLGQLEAGKVEEVPRRVLRQQLGKNWQAIIDGTIPKDGEAKGAKPKSDKSKSDKPKRKKDHAPDKR
ncbi:MAG: pseudouridine synthase [Rhodobiaceae bacterium]|nr:pseudouridine synthase [Rhodobiaceae bacterium]|tara:strand:- start:595 stop:1452 length:858 start_codon:yes stop_codon:yes gene_type:complete